MKQSILQFEKARNLEKLAEDQLDNIKGGSWWDYFWNWWQRHHQGCPPDDDNDDD